MDWINTHLLKQWKQEKEREDSINRKELSKVTLTEDAGGYVYIEYEDTLWLIAYDSRSVNMSELNNFIHYLNTKLEENKKRRTKNVNRYTGI